MTATITSIISSAVTVVFGLTVVAVTMAAALLCPFAFIRFSRTTVKVNSDAATGSKSLGSLSDSLEASLLWGRGPVAA